MKRAAIVLLALLGACHRADVQPPTEFPVIPDLSTEAKADCPPADMVTGQLGDLATKDAQLAIEYAKCRSRHQTVVGAYGDAQARLAAAREKAKAPK